MREPCRTTATLRGGGLHIFGIERRYQALNPDREFVGRQLSESLGVFVKRCPEFQNDGV
jgi:hypothetical protein